MQAAANDGFWEALVARDIEATVVALQARERSELVDDDYLDEIANTLTDKLANS